MSNREKFEHKHFKMGVAPYQLVGLWSMPDLGLLEVNPDAYHREMRTSPKCGIGSCDHCGTGIVHHFVITDARGDLFKVGSTCIEQLGQQSLVSARDAVIREEARRKRADARAHKRLSRQLEFEAQRQAERDRNGGLTDDELAAQERERREQELRWGLCDVVYPVRQVLCAAGDFGNRMVQLMQAGETPSVNAFRICVEILAKRAGRKGSRAYQEALPGAEQQMRDIVEQVQRLMAS